MNCPKCWGVMLLERLDHADRDSYAWKCLICGEILDNIILKNRKMNRADKGREQTSGLPIGNRDRG